MFCWWPYVSDFMGCRPRTTWVRSCSEPLGRSHPGVGRGRAPLPGFRGSTTKLFLFRGLGVCCAELRREASELSGWFDSAEGDVRCVRGIANALRQPMLCLVLPTQHPCLGFRAAPRNFFCLKGWVRHGACYHHIIMKRGLWLRVSRRGLKALFTRRLISRD